MILDSFITLYVFLLYAPYLLMYFLTQNNWQLNVNTFSFFLCVGHNVDLYFVFIPSHYEIYKFFMYTVNYFAVNSPDFSLDVEDYLVGECSKYVFALVVCLSN